jgi:hypothetical protein
MSNISCALGYVLPRSKQSHQRLNGTHDLLSMHRSKLTGPDSPLSMNGHHHETGKQQSSESKAGIEKTARDNRIGDETNVVSILRLIDAKSRRNKKRVKCSGSHPLNESC